MRRFFAGLVLAAVLVYLLFFVQETTRWTIWGGLVAGAVVAALGFEPPRERSPGAVVRVLAGLLALAGAFYLNYLSWNLWRSVQQHAYADSGLMLLTGLRLIFLAGVAGLLFSRR